MQTEMQSVVLTVTQLNTYVRSALESDSKLCGIYLSGEISNFKLHYQSGHMYFTLKDSSASIKAVMFRTAAAGLLFKPADGMKVVCYGRVSLYEKDGSYQFYVTAMQPDGVGSLAVAFEQLKKKLSAEGLFDESRKRPLPQIAKNVSVVTSKTGAALQDILSIANRRAPYANIKVYPVQVQGEAAAPQMCKALQAIYKDGNCDVIIIGRGGGSIEDLWAFNDENLARTIAKSSIPVVSAVGHETDYTICDFVSDKRAPTPSAAAELCFCDINAIYNTVIQYKQRIGLNLKAKIEKCEIDLANAMSNRFFREPELLYESFEKNINELNIRINNTYKKLLEQKSLLFSNALSRLNALSPLNVIARVYSLVTKNGELADSIEKLSCGDTVSITLNGGKATAVISDIERNEQYGI